MDIMVMAIETDSLSNKIFVTCSTVFGNLRAEWKSGIPTINSNYTVELEIPCVFEWGSTITRSMKRECQICQEGGYVYFNGLLESVDDDGCAAVRFGDNLVLLETEGIPFHNGEYVSFKCSNIILFDVNI